MLPGWVGIGRRSCVDARGRQAGLSGPRFLQKLKTTGSALSGAKDRSYSRGLTVAAGEEPAKGSTRRRAGAPARARMGPGRKGRAPR